MQAVTDADSPAMMKRNPTRAARRVQERIEDRPVSNCVRSVFHPFRFAKRRSHRSGIQMIAANRDRSFQIATANQFVDSFAHLCAFAIAEPADARRQSLKLDSIARQ